MYSVTGRISQIKQPSRYIKISDFTKILFHDDYILKDGGNVHPSIIGLVVDYMTRFMSDGNAAQAFKISLTGAYLANKLDTAQKLLSEIHGVDDASIINACKLASFDVYYRSPAYAMINKSRYVPEPDNDSLHNIKIFIERSLRLFAKYGPVVKYGFDFEPSGYTEIISAGDGDFLTADTLWDFKVSKSAPPAKDALQVLIYWIMGKHSGQKVFENINKLAIWNPRLNAAYILETSRIHDQIIREIENDIICYNRS